MRFLITTEIFGKYRSMTKKMTLVIKDGLVGYPFKISIYGSFKIMIYFVLRKFK